MNRNAREERTPTTIGLAVVVCIAVLMLTLGVPTAAARGITGSPTTFMSGHTIVVKPNGHDDTSDIQAAFNTCTSNGWTCTIELVKGTYYTEQITVYGFQGSLVGAGQGRTIIQALPNLPVPAAAYNSLSVPFWAGAPGPANPWPDLFTFVNGAFVISGMTMNEPYANPIIAPGYYWNPNLPAGATASDLWAVVMITGEQAYVSIDHVTINGAGGDITISPGTPSSFNLANGFLYEGMLLPAVWTNPWGDQIPLSGTFSVTNSNLNQALSAIWAQNLLDAQVFLGSNNIASIINNGFFDAADSLIVFSGNVVTNVVSPYGAGFVGFQSVNKAELLPSTVYVLDNTFSVNTGGGGPLFADFGPEDFGVPSTLSAVVSGNVVVTNTSCGCYEPNYVVLFSESLEHYVFANNLVVNGGVGIEVWNPYPGVDTGPGVVAGNVVRGADTGIWVADANNATVIDNLVKNSVQYGIVVSLGANYTEVAYNYVTGSGLYDLYWDGTGVGNVWIGNVYGTSSPPGL